MLQIVKTTAWVCCFLLLMVGCSSTESAKATNGQVLADLLLPEPLGIDDRAQVALLRYNQVIASPELSQDERAELIFQRGVLHDSLGLGALAKMDYGVALQLKPDMAEAHNSLGVHQLLAKEFMQAYESFDASLEINPNYSFATLNRAIALYYGGRPKLALGDIRQFVQDDVTDPYRVLWQFIISHQVDPVQAEADLQNQFEALDDAHWAVSLVEHYLAKHGEGEVLTRLLLDVENQKQLNDRLCEAYFYLGKLQQIKGNQYKAKNYFKLALGTNIQEYIEFRYARFELGLLRSDAL